MFVFSISTHFLYFASFNKFKCLKKNNNFLKITSLILLCFVLPRSRWGVRLHDVCGIFARSHTEEAFEAAPTQMLSACTAGVRGR